VEVAGSQQVRLTVAGDGINCRFIAKQVWGNGIDCQTGVRTFAWRLPGVSRYVSLLREMELTVSLFQTGLRETELTVSRFLAEV